MTNQQDEWQRFQAIVAKLIEDKGLRGLASFTGVSTTTLSAIAKREKWCKPTTPKNEKDWARIVATLVLTANFSGYSKVNAQAVLKDLELPADEELVRHANELLNQTASPFSDAYRNDPALRRIFATGSPGKSDYRLEAIVMRFPPFGKDKKGFLPHFATTLLATIFPDSSIRLQESADIEAAMAKLYDDRDPRHLVVGLLDTIPRRMRGLHFIPIPGVKCPVVARVLHKQTQEITLKAGDLNDYLFRIPRNRRKRDDIPQLLVQNGEVGQLFINGVCRFAKDQVSLFDEVSELDELLEQKEGPFVLIAAYTVAVEIEHLVDDKKLWISTEVGDEQELDLPSYNIAIAIREDALSWRELLADAVNELYGSHKRVLRSVFRDLVQVLREREPHQESFLDEKRLAGIISNDNQENRND